MELIPRCPDHILGIPDGKQRFCNTVLKLAKGFALCGATDEAMALAEEVAFLQAVGAPLIKRDGGSGGTSQDPDFALRQLLSETLVAEGVTDIFKVAGLKSPSCPTGSWRRGADSPEEPGGGVAATARQGRTEDQVQNQPGKAETLQ